MHLHEIEAIQAAAGAAYTKVLITTGWSTIIVNLRETPDLAERYGKAIGEAMLLGFVQVETTPKFEKWGFTSSWVLSIAEPKGKVRRIRLHFRMREKR